MAPASDPFESLDDSLVSYIFCKLTPSARSLRRCQLVCKRWNRITKLVTFLNFSDISEDDEAVIWQFLSSNLNIRSLSFDPSEAYREISVNIWLQKVSSTLESLEIRHPNFRYVLSCQKLVILQLHFCTVAGFSFGLPCLRTLLLDSVTVSDEDLDAFLVLCPELKYLDLDLVGNNVKINCPKLNTVIVTILDAKITISNSSCLEHVCIDSISEIVFEDPKPRLETATFLIASEKTLECIQDLSVGRLVVHPENPFQRLKLSKLSKHITMVEELEMTAWFFKSLQVESRKHIDGAGKCLSQLKEIKVRFEEMNKTTINKLGSLLSCCSTLKRLYIFYKTLSKEVFNDVLRLQQSNSNVRVTCHQEHLPDPNVDFIHSLPDVSFVLD